MSLYERIRAIITLHRFQAIVGIAAGFLSIGATVWGILFATRAPASPGSTRRRPVTARAGQIANEQQGNGPSGAGVNR